MATRNTGNFSTASVEVARWPGPMIPGMVQLLPRTAVHTDAPFVVAACPVAANWPSVDVSLQVGVDQAHAEQGDPKVKVRSC